MTSPWPPPSDPAQQQPGLPPPQPPKKKRGGLIAGAIVAAVVLLAVCCGGGIAGYIYWEEEQDIQLLYTTYEEIDPPAGFTSSKAKLVDGIAMVKGKYSLEGWKPGDKINPVDESLLWFQKVAGRAISEDWLTSQCYGKNTSGCSEQFKIDDQRLSAYFTAVHTSSSINFYIEVSVQPPISD